MVQSVSPLNKKEPNGIQETNIKPIKPVTVLIQMDLINSKYKYTEKNQESIETTVSTSIIAGGEGSTVFVVYSVNLLLIVILLCDLCFMHI